MYINKKEDKSSSMFSLYGRETPILTLSLYGRETPILTLSLCGRETPNNYTYIITDLIRKSTADSKF